jgi:putative (di)nucleoside polyphosphate hydrolase
MDVPLPELNALALRFAGDDGDIRLDAHGAPEFDAWAWADLAAVPAMVVGFKRPIYDRLARDFAALARP